jgi:alpha-beta hydrolase superfamily lysophospholipase
MRVLTLLLALLLASPAFAAEVVLKTADGLSLHAVHEPVAGAKRAVLLVHGDGRSAADWKFLATKLKQAGISTLALDLRGHGTSPAAGPTPLSDATWAAMSADVDAGLAFLRAAGATEIGLVGAEVGASLALLAGAAAADATTMVVLTPGLKLHGLRFDAALKAWNPRPILFIVSGDEAYAAKSSLLLEAQATGPKHLEIYTSAGAGAAMLNREPACEGLVLSWLLGTYDLSADQARGAAPQIQGSEEAMPTDGPTLEEVIGK